MYLCTNLNQTKMNKYYKLKNGNVIVQWVNDLGDNKFIGRVIMVDVAVTLSPNYLKWDYKYFTKYTPTPQELIEWGETDTLTNYNPNKVEVDDKDINLRLRCLELAMQGNIVDPLSRAKRFYDWITQKPLTNETPI